MTAKIVDLNCVSRLNQPAEKILRRAEAANLSDIVVCGWDENGEFWFASSSPDGGDVIWLLEIAKKRLLEAGGA